MPASDTGIESGSDHSVRPDDSFSRLRELFAAVADLDVAARVDWITAHVIDADERNRLLRLLAADETGSGFLATPVSEHLARLDGDDGSAGAGDLIGERIGAFRLVRSLGKGGMAEVFLGEREGGDFVQRVAVKLLRRGLYSDVEQRLFRRERQLLAGLEHPNIARLIDGGLTAAGIPYLVIEFIDGVPITRYAAERHLGVRARVELFLVVCRAVEAAHRALIVHRDIKPSNILVAEDGSVKLLDFGIAKLLEEDVESPTIGVFTPDYAAPEQLAGAAVTTATDVYALGVLLHELLLGSRPQAGATRRPSSLARAAVGRKDATVPNPSALPRALRGDLDTIILKCLAEEPALRYASAGTLADDVQRHLSGRPVEAHPPSHRYRIVKFVQRHRSATLLTAVLLFGLLAALAIALWQAGVARREAARAHEVQDFVESLFHPLQEAVARDRTPSVRELLQRGLARVDASFAGDRPAQAELLSMFARIDDSIGEVKANRELSERAARLSAMAFGPDDLRTLQARELHARVLGQLGEDRAALEELTAVRGAMQARQVHGLAYATLLDDLSSLRMDQGAGDDEIIALRREELSERESDPAHTPESLASGYNNLGVAYDRASQWPAAMQWYRKAYEADMQAKGDSFASAVDLGNVGNIEYWTGHWRESVATLSAARAMYERVGIDNHPNLVSLLTRLCDEQAQLELDADAAATCAAAVAMAVQVLGAATPSHAMALIRRAGARIGAGHYAEARADLAQARAIYAAFAGDSRRALRIADVTEAALDYRLGDDAALRDHLQAVAVGAADGRSPSAPRTFAWFALACRHAPGPACAADPAHAAERVLADAGFAGHPNQLPGSVALARIELERGDAKAAIARVEAALGVTAAQLGERHSWIGEAHLVLGDARRALGDAAAAHREYATASDALAALPDQDPLRARAAAALREAH